MARVKNTLRRGIGETLGLPKAKFPAAKETLAACNVCGLTLRKSNLARHARNRHERGRVLRPEASSPTTSVKLSKSPREGLKLKIRLPAVDRRLQDIRASTSSEEEEEPGRCLPPTPSNDEELYRELAKLYAARVPQKQPSTLSYDQTKMLLTVARDESVRKDLKAVLATSGLVLQTQTEWEQNLEAAEAKGRSHASQVLQSADSSPPVLDQAPPAPLPVVQDVPATFPSVPQPTSPVEVPTSVPPLCVTSHFEEGKPQIITLHSGGSWGIRISPYQVQ